jgi:hypothetical protein
MERKDFIRKLREATGLGLGECVKIYDKHSGNYDQAFEELSASIDFSSKKKRDFFLIYQKFEGEKNDYTNLIVYKCYNSDDTAVRNGKIVSIFDKMDHKNIEKTLFPLSNLLGYQIEVASIVQIPGTD